MPDTWIKLRDDLDTDPRVARMAAALAPMVNGYFFGSGPVATVTRHVMRDVTIAGLTRVWSHANRHTQDGVFRHVDLDYLDDLSRIPGFGQAMALVGWAIHDAAAGTVTLPNFQEHNAPNKGGLRAQTADARRAQRRRDRLKALQAAMQPDPPVTGRDRDDVTVESVTPPVTKQRSPSISISESISESTSTSESGREGEPDFRVLEHAKTRINRLRQSWAKLPHWSAEEETALFAALPNLRAMEDQDWDIIAFWLRWAHSKANTENRDPVRVTSRRHVFVTELPANLDRATAHWKQSGSPRLNRDGSKVSAPPRKEQPPPLTHNENAFLGLLKSNGANLPPHLNVATQPAA